MNQYVDKEKQYKSIDLSLMARLLKYAKLYQPVLLGKAVDEFIVN